MFNEPLAGKHCTASSFLSKYTPSLWYLPVTVLRSGEYNSTVSCSLGKLTVSHALRLSFPPTLCVLGEGVRYVCRVEVGKKHGLVSGFYKH